MRLEEFAARLLHPFESQLAGVFACRGSTERRDALLEWLRLQGNEPLPLRPPSPWDDLAPLRQLLARAGSSLPEPDPGELDFIALWLGPLVPMGRLFQRSAFQLSSSRILAVGAYEDLASPVWGALLNFVRLGRLHMPVAFLLEAKAGTKLPSDIPAIDLDALEADALPATRAKPRLGKRARAYLAQACFFGDVLRPDLLGRVTRANQERHKDELLALELVDPMGRIAWHRLRHLDLPPLPQSRRWKERAWQALRRGGMEDTPQALWLRAQLPAAKAAIPALRAAEAMLTLGVKAAGSLLRTLSPKQLEPEAQALRLLLEIDSREESPHQPIEERIASLGMPYALLLQGRLTRFSQERDAPDRLAACRDRLKANGYSEEAALLSLELARWHFAHFRTRPGLLALAACGQPRHWALRWLKELLHAEAYLRMARVDFARSHAQKAIEIPPLPMSPILKSDLYLVMGRIFSQGKLDAQVENALENARECYLSLRDGTRMARYLLVRGEIAWAARDFEAAKNAVSRAIRILHHYGEGLLLQEAELKLALIYEGIPYESIGA